MSERSNSVRARYRSNVVFPDPGSPDLTLVELLEKAQEFGNKAYSSSLSTYAFLERAMEAGKKYSTSTMEIAGLATKTRQVFQLLAEVNVAF